jgi:STE24 endopeptidase
MDPEHRGADDALRQPAARALARARRRVAAVETAVSLAVLGVAAALAPRAGAPVALAVLAGGLAAASLAGGAVRHRLSHRFGLSRQTFAGWLADWVKGALVGGVLAAVAGAAAVLLQRASEDWWWVGLWLGAVALSALLALAFPVLLLPLFLRSEPLREGALADALRATADAAGVAVRELRLLRMGEKTAAANAMVAGLGPSRRIYVSDTLVEGDDGEALDRARVVLAHELAHQVHGDLWRGLAVSALPSLAGALGAWAAVALLAPDEVGTAASLPATALGFTLGSAAASPLAAWHSRRRERAADAYAVRVTAAGDVYARALERLVAQNLIELDPPRLLHALSGSHPAPGERIRAARAV